MITKVVRLDETEVANETGGTRWVKRTPKVGDEIILHPRLDHDPVITGNVSRITKTQFRVTGTDGKEHGPFKIEGGWFRDVSLKEDGTTATYEDQRDPEVNVTRYCWTRFAHHVRKSYDKYTRCEFNCPFLAELAEREAAEAKKRIDDKRAAEAARQQEYADRIARELAEVKEACGNPASICRMVLPDRMPDGSRIYTVDIPVRPQYAERKKGWERLIIRCWDGHEVNWDAPRESDGSRAFIRATESAYTYCNGGSSSFTSVSTSRYSNDEEAVWDAIRSRYHDGW